MKTSVAPPPLFVRAKTLAKVAVLELKSPAAYELPFESIAALPACSSALPCKPATHCTAPVPRSA